MKLSIKKQFISSALPYVNSVPHLGFALEIVQADTIARYHRALDEEVFFLTGTDENALKVARAAEKAGIKVAEFADQNARKFKGLKQALNLSFDDFIRTTEERHVKAVHRLWKACKKDIYKKKYKGLYCVGCEQFYKQEELINGFCPEHNTKPELVEEENYFFKLSEYEKQLKELIESDTIKIIPESRKNEALGFLNKGLEDICISRSAERARGWGIDVPGDPSQKHWCWWEAVLNYISALGYGTNDRRFQEWWEENDNKLHMIGKGILIFHALYWPAALLSAGVSLPNKLFVHGYISVGGQKISKSLGNIVDPYYLVDKYGTDAVRYFLLREFSSTKDGDFTTEKFEERYNSDLAKGLGNFVARVLKLAQKPSIKSTLNQCQNPNVQKEISETQRNCYAAIERFSFDEALKFIWNLIGFCDRYIEQERPWQGRENKESVINDLLLAIQEIARLLEPFLPQSSENILGQIKTRRVVPLFPRLN